MKETIDSGAFRRDIKRLRKRGYDMEKLAQVVSSLVNGQTLLPRHRPHMLTGNWEGHWELHIEPDWLLIYQITPDAVYLARTGTHSDLF